MSPWLLIAVVLAVLLRLRRAVGVERQQVKWFAYAAAIFAIACVLNVSILAIDVPLWVEWANLVIFPVAGTTIPIAVGIAILRYRLYNIDILINRTLVYGALTAALVAIYFGGIVMLQRLFVLFTDQHSTLAVLASTLVIAALFTSLRRRIQGLIDRSFYRRKYDARSLLGPAARRNRPGGLDR